MITRFLLFFFLSLSSFLIQAHDLSCDAPREQKNHEDPLLVIVLMVKDEALVIKETLQPYLSVRSDCAFFVFDTGSADDTVAVTKKFFQDNQIDRVVIEQEAFVDFSTSRNRALQLAQDAFPQATFMLMPDAEWYLRNVDGLIRFCAEHKHDKIPSYLVRIKHSLIDFYTPRLMRCRSGIQFVGVVHEILNSCAVEKVSPEVFFWWSPIDTSIKKSQKRWVRDCALLLQEYERNPSDPRTVFYLAQTYDCLDDLKNACLWYERRMLLCASTAVFLNEENFLTSYRLARVYEKLGNWEKALSKYLTAYSIRPVRAEPLIRLAKHYWDSGEIATSFVFAQRAVEIPYPIEDQLPIDKELYEYTRYDLLGCAAWYVEKYELGLEAVTRAMQVSPDASHLRENMNLYTQKLAELGIGRV
jgi:tetratricopeptide (TPR) repeat protein